MSGFAPQRRFSQNFLTDPSTADKIVAALDIQPGDVVMEIGPGKGMLTQRLAASAAAKIVAVDLDPRAIEHCQRQDWASPSRVEFIQADALTVDLASIFVGTEPSARKVIGNIPYSITSDILFWLFQHRARIGRAVIMMQREVARRCVADKGTKDYGILRMATQLASQASLLFHVKPGSFFPRPDVTSSVVRFMMHPADPYEVPMEEIMPFIRAAFSQRRKVLVNALESYCAQTLGTSARELVRKHRGQLRLNIETVRAEECTVEQLIGLYTDLRGVLA